MPPDSDETESNLSHERGRGTRTTICGIYQSFQLQQVNEAFFSLRKDASMLTDYSKPNRKDCELMRQRDFILEISVIWVWLAGGQPMQTHLIPNGKPRRIPWH